MASSRPKTEQRLLEVNPGAIPCSGLMVLEADLIENFGEASDYCAAHVEPALEVPTQAELK